MSDQMSSAQIRRAANPMKRGRDIHHVGQIKCKLGQGRIKMVEVFRKGRRQGK